MVVPFTVGIAKTDESRKVRLSEIPSGEAAFRLSMAVLLRFRVFFRGQKSFAAVPRRRPVSDGRTILSGCYDGSSHLPPFLC
jgi:hypothetical protein